MSLTATNKPQGKVELKQQNLCRTRLKSKKFYANFRFLFRYFTEEESNAM